MTHNQRVLALLSDGEPHSYHEGYRLGVMLHSRVSDLRKQGHAIKCVKTGRDYLYQLVSSGDATSRVPSPDSSSPKEAPGPDPSSLAPGQMSLIEAAA